MARRHVADQVLHRLGAFLLRQPPPLLGQPAQSLVVNLARAAIVGDAAVLHRIVGLSATRRAAAVGTGAAVGVGGLFQLLDELVQPSDDFLLDLLRLRAAAG